MSAIGSARHSPAGGRLPPVPTAKQTGVRRTPAVGVWDGRWSNGDGGALFRGRLVLELDVVALQQCARDAVEFGDRRVVVRQGADLLDLRFGQALLGGELPVDELGAERVADFLLEMAARNPNASEVDLPMSRQDIADYLGLTIETVSRMVTQLERSGTIALATSRRVVLRKRAALSRMNA